MALGKGSQPSAKVSACTNVPFPYCPLRSRLVVPMSKYRFSHNLWTSARWRRGIWTNPEKTKDYLTSTHDKYAVSVPFMPVQGSWKTSSTFAQTSPHVLHPVTLLRLPQNLPCFRLGKIASLR